MTREDQLNPSPVGVAATEGDVTGEAPSSHSKAAPRSSKEIVGSSGCRPRVLIVIAQLDVGGAEVQAVQLAIQLKQSGEFEPEVAVFYRGGVLEPRLQDGGIRVHHVRRRTKIGWEAVMHLRSILREGAHDVVHSFLWPANWRSRVASALARTRVTIASERSVPDSWPLHRNVMDRILLRRTDALIVNARAVGDFFVEREGVPRSLVHVIYNGLDSERFASLPERRTARRSLSIDPDRPMVLSVAGLRPAKNLEDFVRMAALIHRGDPAVTFVVVGDGERRSSLESMTHDLGLEEVVHWAGLQTNVETYLAACDVMVNTSVREGCCNAIMEAMAAARPVVAYAVGGNHELVQQGRTGQLVPFGDVDGLAGAVETYLRNPERAAQDGAEAARRIAESMDRRVTFEQTISLYRELLSAKGA